MKELEQNFIEWAKARGIYEHSDAKSQLLKGVSEMGELADAVCKGQHEKIVDGIGDVIVCLTHVAFMSGTDLTECMHKAWQDIKDRKGRMVAGGVFVKDESEPSKREKIPEGYKPAFGADSIIKKLDALLAIFPHALETHKFSVSGHGFLKTDSGETKFYEKWAADNLFTELRDGIREVRTMLKDAPSLDSPEPKEKT